MGLRINNNIASINGRNNMLRNDAAVASSMEKLSSGLRINKAADDAAGLVISEQMRAQIAGINQAIDNSETAISMVQTAEGALDEVNNLLTKARELVLRAANDGANDSNQLAANQAELDNVIASVSRISEVTQFGTKKLLDGALDGSSSLSSGLNRVDVGNLSNNAAVAVGNVSIQTSGFVFESQELGGGGVVDNGNIFGTSGISGVEELTATTVVNSGTVASVTIDGTSYSTTSTGATVSAIVTDLNSQLTTASADFEVSVGMTGGLNVSRTTAGSTDFVSSVSFAKASGTTAQDALSTATISVTAGTNSGAASAVFASTTSLSTVSASTAFNASGTIINAQVQGSGGTTNVSYTVTGGATMQDAFDSILADLGSGSAGLSGAALSVVAASGGGSLAVTLDSNNQALEAITFTMEIDLPSNSSTDEEMVAFRLDNMSTATVQAALFSGGGVSGTNGVLQTGGTPANVELASGTVMNLDIDGQSFSVIGTTTGVSLDDAVANLQAQIDAAMGSGVIQITAISGVEAGDTAFGMDLTGTDSLVTGVQILIGRYDNNTTSLTGATLTFENTSITGTDTAATTVAINDGSGVQGTAYNLDTSGSTGSTSQSGATAQAASTLASVTGSTTVTNGNVGVTATMTTANGVQLDLVSSGATSTGGGATLVLSNATGNAGYQDVRIEVDGTTAAASSSSLSFALDDGAVFQVGANAGQTVGLTIADIDAGELGRNVADSGTLSSLNDLISTEQSALTNGLTEEALRVIDSAIDEVTNLRGSLGAFQANTLETGLNSLRVSGENLTAAESTIRDVDFAEESARFARNNIMIQASTAMLAQANQLPQNVLQLLG